MNKLYQYKNPYYDMFVSPYGYAFFKEGKCLGRIIWRRQSELDGITIEKDED